MKLSSLFVLGAALGSLLAGINLARAQSTAFTYQGWLNDGAGPANGSYDLTFALFEAPSSGTQQGVTLTNTTTAVSNGLFTVTLDFGNQFPGDNRWLEIGVRTNGAADLATLAPRQQLTAAPYAVQALNATSAATANSVAAGSISGTLSAAQLPANVVTNNQTGLTLGGTFNGSFTGNGGGLTSLNASQLTGTIGSAQITDGTISNVDIAASAAIAYPKLNLSGSIVNADISASAAIADSKLATISTAAKVANTATTAASANTANAIVARDSSGNFSAGTVTATSFIGSGASLTALNASQLASGTVVDARLSANVALRVGGNTFSGNQTNTGGSLYLDNMQTVLAKNSSGSYEVFLWPRWLDNVSYLNYGAGGFNIRNNSSTPTLFMTSGGNVGIGTTTPTKAALEIDSQSGSQPGYNPVGYLGTGGAGTGNVTAGNASIWAAGWIFGLEFVAFSDERIKDIKGQSDSAADLKTLLSIQVTDYTYKDTISKGNGPQKKVIAQQVERVYPQAVTKSTDVVPDIYRKATLRDGWVEMATDLKVGERVKLIGEKEKGIYPVLEVRDGAFRTDFKPATNQIFVYGREVKDFRNVDYEAIAMLNVSATQELARKLAAKDGEVSKLQTQVSQLEQKAAQAQALAQKVDDLQKLVAQLAEESRRGKLASKSASQPHAAAAALRPPLTTASLQP